MGVIAPLSRFVAGYWKTKTSRATLPMRLQRMRMQSCWQGVSKQRFLRLCQRSRQKIQASTTLRLQRWVSEFAFRAFNDFLCLIWVYHLLQFEVAATEETDGTPCTTLIIFSKSCHSWGQQNDLFQRWWLQRRSAERYTKERQRGKNDLQEFHQKDFDARGCWCHCQRGRWYWNKEKEEENHKDTCGRTKRSSSRNPCSCSLCRGWWAGFVLHQRANSGRSLARTSGTCVLSVLEVAPTPTVYVLFLLSLLWFLLGSSRLRPKDAVCF